MRMPWPQLSFWQTFWPRHLARRSMRLAVLAHGHAAIAAGQQRFSAWIKSLAVFRTFAGLVLQRGEFACGGVTLGLYASGTEQSSAFRPFRTFIRMRPRPRLFGLSFAAPSGTKSRRVKRSFSVSIFPERVRTWLSQLVLSMSPRQRP